MTNDSPYGEGYPPDYYEGQSEPPPDYETPTCLDPGPIVKCMADVSPQSISWLWPGRIPAGRITLLVGRPGEGKSFMTIDVASRVSTGTPWPDGSDCPKGSVILMSAEDDPGDTIRPRLDAHRADVSKVHLLSAVRRVDKKGSYEQLISMTDIDAIETTLEQLGDCRLIVIDPVGSYLPGRTDAHRDNEVRSVLAPVAALAEKYGVAVLLVAHRRKSVGTNADETAIGSRAFTGIARAVWHISRDGNDEHRRLLLPGKNNLARQCGGLAFSIIDDPPRISWERDPVEMTADDAMAAEAQLRKPGPEAEAQGDAIEWLRDALSDGPCKSKELLDEWVNGHAGSKRTLDRAKKELRVESFRLEPTGPWWCRLSQVANPPQGKELGDLGNVEETPGKSDSIKSPGCHIAKLNDLAPCDNVDGNGRVRFTI